MKKLLAILAMAVSFAVAAQQPTIKIILPYAPGGVADKVGRVVERNLTQRLPYNFIVEFHAGANGLLATNILTKNKTKEVVLTIIGPNVVINSMSPDANYDYSQDLVSVANLGSVPLALVANSKSQFVPFNKLITSDKPMFFGGGGHGSATHLSGELLKIATGRDMTFAPYKGEAAAFNDILNGSLSFTFISAANVVGYVGGDQVAVMAVTGTQRHSKMPTVPTLEELNIKGFRHSMNWLMLMANASADPVIIAQIKTAMLDAATKDRDAFLAAGIEIDPNRLNNGIEFLNNEATKLKPIVSKLK